MLFYLNFILFFFFAESTVGTTTGRKGNGEN